MRALALRALRLWPLAVLVTAAMLGAFAWTSRPIAASAVEIVPGTVAREAVGTGTIESEAVVEVAFTVPGRIREIHVEEGDAIRPGDLLATIDASELERQVVVARRGAELARAGVERTEADIRRAEIARDAALEDRRRAEELFARGALPRAELDAAVERAARAEAEHAAALAARRQGRSTVAAAVDTVRLQQDRSDEGSLRSPLEGVVVRRLHEPGDVVQPGATVLVVASTRKVWARTWMDETFLHELREGQDARVVLRGDPTRAYRARVDRVALEADRQTHEVLVDLELVERPARLVFGQRADGIVVLEARDVAARVPQGACELEAGRCFVAREGRVAEARVRVGLAGSEWVEIEDGIAPGQRVLVASDEPLVVGRRVAESAR